MLHEPAANNAPDPATVYKTRLGLKMFATYSLVYAGFVFANVLTEGRAMEPVIFAGLNVAVVYGMTLIIGALALALVYNHKCTAKEKELQAPSAPVENSKS